MTEQEAYLVLNAIPGLGTVKTRQLIDFFGSAVDVLAQDEQGIIHQGSVAPPIATNIVHFSKDKFLSDEYNLLTLKGAGVITLADDNYPLRLKEIPGAPLVLYILGQQSILNATSIGMVGSRVCSYYGQSMAHQFAMTFAQAGLVVVSGLARGIDTAAHQGCLKGDGATIAVLGCGLNHVYPRENKGLLEQIVVKGAVISELPMTTPPLPVHFPRRNRIISGLSTAVVVVEAGEKSGALITVNYALEQSREVFAIPANIDYTSARGSNLLIKDGARVALSPMDVLEEIKGQLNLEFSAMISEGDAPSLLISEEQMKYYQLLTSEPMHIDDLVLRVNNGQGNYMEDLLDLELKGIIKQLPGKYFVRT